MVFSQLLYIESENMQLNGSAILKETGYHLPYRYLLRMGILSTCKVLREEGWHFFFTANNFEFQVVLCHPVLPALGYTRCNHMMAFIPAAPIRPELLCSLRLKVEIFGPWKPGSTFSWSGLREITNLKKLHITVTQKAYSYESPSSNSVDWKGCPVVNHITKGIVEHVPSQVELRWGGWNALFVDRDGTLRGFPMRDLIIIIEGHLLEEVAQDYGHWRGRKLVIQRS